MLLSIWLLIGLAGLTLVAAAGLVWVEVHRRRRRRAGTMGAVRAWSARLGSVVLVLVLAMTTIADKENRDFRYIPSFAALFGNPSADIRDGGLGTVDRYLTDPHLVSTKHGTDVEVTIPGARSGIRRVAYVYLPPQYFEPRYRHHRFPVLYLIHGSPGVAVDWIRGGQIDRTMDHLLTAHAVQPFIVVMPDANGGFGRDLECQDVVGGPMDQTYLAHDVVTWTDAHLRTQPDRLHRAIGGLSTGGYCAINLMFRHQDTFSAAVSHSGSGKPDHGRYTGNLFGTDHLDQYRNTPDDYLRTIPIAPATAVYLDAGQDDSWSLHGYRPLHPLLLARHVPTTLHIFRGERHSFDAWRRNSSVSLQWLSKWFTTRSATTVADRPHEPSATYLPPLQGRYDRHPHHDGHHQGHHSGHHKTSDTTKVAARRATAVPDFSVVGPPSTVP
jgi:enterochelin esterase-like enzyme